MENYDDDLLQQIGELGIDGASELEARLDERKKIQKNRAAAEEAVREMYRDLFI